MDIKRENWRGRYVVTIRDRGRLVSWRKYSSKITLKRYGSHFKQNKSLDLNIKRVKLYDYYEVTHFKPKDFKFTHKFQVCLSARVGKKNFYARSDKYPKNYSYKSAKIEAEQRLFSNMADLMGFGYDSQKGRKIIAEKNIKIKEHIVYYEKIRK